jgi:uncharacterized protein (TIGR02266 family)
VDEFSLHFRRFLYLDRKRTRGPLTPAELRRWLKLKRILNREFTPERNSEGLDSRQSVRVPAQVGVSFRDLGELRECLMSNVSRGGVFIVTDDALDIGTRFELRIQLEKTGESIDVPVEVVSQNARPDRATFEPGMGLRFCEMTPEAREKIDELYELVLAQAGERVGARPRAAGSQAVE